MVLQNSLSLSTLSLWQRNGSIQDQKKSILVTIMLGRICLKTTGVSAGANCKNLHTAYCTKGTCFYGWLQVSKRNIERTEDLLDAYFMQVLLLGPVSKCSFRLASTHPCGPDGHVLRMLLSSFRQSN